MVPEESIERERGSRGRYLASEVSVAAVVEEVAIDGTTGIATLTRSIIGGIGVYTKWFCSANHLMCSLQVAEMLEITAFTFFMILYFASNNNVAILLQPDYSWL